MKIFARLNRAKLGDFDDLVLGLFLMAQYQGQLVVPDGGFYLRDSHADTFLKAGSSAALIPSSDQHHGAVFAPRAA
jgi:hypothetical protein